MYNAPTDRLVEIVRSAGNGSERLLIVGHNPGFQELVLRLASDDPGEHSDHIVDGFPTAAIAAVELPAGRWREIAERSGRIVDLILPRNLGD